MQWQWVYTWCNHNGNSAIKLQYIYKSAVISYQSLCAFSNCIIACVGWPGLKGWQTACASEAFTVSDHLKCGLPVVFFPWPGYHCIEHPNICPPPYPTLPPQPLGQHVVGPFCLCYPRVNLLLHVIVGCDDTAQIGKGRDILKSITSSVDVLRGNTGIRHCTHLVLKRVAVNELYMLV